MIDSGILLLTRSPNGLVRSARISENIPTLLPIIADIALASVHGNPYPPAHIES